MVKNRKKMRRKKKEGKQNSQKSNVSKKIKIPSKDKKVFSVPVATKILKLYCASIRSVSGDVWDLFCCHKLYLILQKLNYPCMTSGSDSGNHENGCLLGYGTV
jgi:hypothetical protein